MISGDVLMLPKEGKLLGKLELDEPLDLAYQQGRIDASAVLWGDGELLSEGPMRTIEQRVADEYEELAQGLVGAGLKQQRRPLRLRPGALRWQCDDQELLLCFSLPPGTYATSLVRELVITSTAEEG